MFEVGGRGRPNRTLSSQELTLRVAERATELVLYISVLIGETKDVGLDFRPRSKDAPTAQTMMIGTTTRPAFAHSYLAAGSGEASEVGIG